MNERVVTVRAVRCVIHLNLPIFFERSTQANIVKLLKLLFTNSYEEVNRETISVLDDYLPGMATDKKSAWTEASRSFQNEYRDPKRYTRKEAPAVRAKNERLHECVKTSKREYEKACKVAEIYTSSKAKYM